MFCEGEIIYFTPFYFKNGHTAKNKYFIVLRSSANGTILASLPTSVNKIPASIMAMHGCVNHDDRCFNCYYFEAGRPVCENGFYFSRPTHVYGNEVDSYEIAVFSSVYGIEGVDYNRVGVLLPQEFNDLVSCIRNSASVKRKIKRLL